MPFHKPKIHWVPILIKPGKKKKKEVILKVFESFLNLEVY
jgi:hypothetical protein